MSWLSDLITGGTTGAISGTLGGIGDAAIKIREAITGDITPEAKAKLQEHLAELDTQLNLAQAKVDEVEAASGTFFVAGWRPFIGWIGGFGLTYTFIAQPLLTWASTNFHWQTPPSIDSSGLTALVVSMLGIGGMRSLEKIQGVNNVH